MIRRLVIATTLAAALGIGGASFASAVPDTTASRVGCVVVRPADESVCVSSPELPKLPKAPKLPSPPLP